ncbi:MAG: Crp/Fnr family transcriptional regulator, partial [Pseudorhodoplanes sp.]
ARKSPDGCGLRLDTKYPKDEAPVDPVELIGYAAVVVNIGVYLMRTMIPLRIFAVATNVLFIAYAFFAGVYPTLLLNCILLPLNAFRLMEMLILVRKARAAAIASDFDVDFIKPYTRKRLATAGEVLFRKGDQADAMYLVRSGTFTVPELGIAVAPGTLVGELGLLAPGGRRTQSLVCVDGGELLALSYDRFRQLFLQNPKFGFSFLQLTAGRLFENIGVMERTLVAHGIDNPLAGRAARLEAAVAD